MNALENTIIHLKYVNYKNYFLYPVYLGSQSEKLSEVEESK